MDKAKSAGSSRPNRDDLAPAEYQRRLHAYVQTPEYKASDRELRGAVVLSKAHDAALLRAAHELLARRSTWRACNCCKSSSTPRGCTAPRCASRPWSFRWYWDGPVFTRGPDVAALLEAQADRDRPLGRLPLA
ncbi:hypothetical protein ACWD4O_46900 [Streptomyces sp. NPDC002623]